MENKPIQICISGNNLFVLREDGSLWYLHNNKYEKWTKLPDLPKG